MTDKNLGLMVQHAKTYVENVLRPRCDTIMSEVAISINWAEGKAEILVGVTGRQYPEREGWQNGTADLVCILKTGELLIADWKTGGTDGSTEQLLSLACGFREALKDGGLFCEDKPRDVRTACLAVDNEGVWPDERPVSPDELSNHWFAMEMAWADKDKKNEPVPGIHCTQLYCPHLAYCTAITGIITDASAADGNNPMGSDKLIPPTSLARRRLSMTDRPSSAEEAGYTMARVTAARRQLKYYQAAMEQYVSKGGRVVSGKYEWRETGNGMRWCRLK